MTAAARFDQLCEGWLDLACQCGIAVQDQDGDLPPGVLEAISRTVSAAIWFGLTVGYMTLTGSYQIPRKLLPCWHRARARCVGAPGTGRGNRLADSEFS